MDMPWNLNLDFKNLKIGQKFGRDCFFKGAIAAVFRQPGP